MATAERYLYTCRLNMLFDRGNDRPGRLSREVCDVVPKFRSFGGGGGDGSFESISENFL